MLKKHSQFLESILVLMDIAVITIAWIAAYHIRFSGIFIPVFKGIPSFSSYLSILLPIVLLWPFIFKNLGLYKPRRISSHLSEMFDIIKACSIAVIILISSTYLIMHDAFSRLVFIYFWFISVLTLIVERWIFREIMRIIRRKGYNLRHVLIVGAGDLGGRISRKINENPWTGLTVTGYIDDSKKAEERVEGGKILGRTREIKQIINEYGIDQVFIALPLKSYSRIMYIVEALKDEVVTVRVVPDIYQAMTLNASVEEFDGMPLINLTESPMHGWNIIVKRSFDIILSIFAIILISPLMLLIVIVLKATSRGPIFFSQERMGLDGRTFNILKFRSMKVDAEVETGAVWASENDPRRTKLGTFLRATSLDELPQFFNVLKGDMSIVGPRPERPVFINEFKKNIPKYMLRHKVKAGITGWAQVNGWRGNTCLEKRIECDIYYIENWSIWFDIKIMCLTVWKGLINKHAY